MNCGLPWLPWAVWIHKETPFVERLCQFATVPLLMLNSTFPSKTACFLFLFLFVPPEVRLGVLCKARRGRNEGLHWGYTSVPGLESSCQYSLCSLLGRSSSKPSSSSPPSWLGSAYVLLCKGRLP